MSCNGRELSRRHDLQCFADSDLRNFLKTFGDAFHNRASGNLLADAEHDVATCLRLQQLLYNVLAAHQLVDAGYVFELGALAGDFQTNTQNSIDVCRTARSVFIYQLASIIAEIAVFAKAVAGDLAKVVRNLPRCNASDWHAEKRTNKTIGRHLWHTKRNVSDAAGDGIGSPRHAIFS